MNTGKQINAMVVILFVTVIAIGAYTIWDPFRSESAEDTQLERTVERGSRTFALNCRLCHGDRGQGGAAGGRLPQALPLDSDFLQGIEGGVFSEAALEEVRKLVVNTITCGRVGTFMPIWGDTQGGTLNEEQIRQLAILITEGSWELAQAHADEIDAEATGHATVRMSDGVFGANETELVVSSAAPFSVGQFIRIEGERLQISAIPSTGQQLAEDIGKTPRGFLASGAEGIGVGAIIRLDGELLEVTAIRDDGDPDIVLEGDVSTTTTLISVSDPAFFREGYVMRVGGELIRVVGPVDTGQTLGNTIGRAETTFTVSGSEGIRPGVLIRMGEELLRVIDIQPARLEVQRGVDNTDAASHGSGTAILGTVGDEEEDTGELLTQTIGPSDTSFTVSGTTGLASGETFQLDDELVLVVDIEPARLRVERGVGGTSRAEHARRVSLFEGNLLEVERGVGGAGAAHREGDQVFLTALEVRRAVEGSDREVHSKGAEIFLGHRLIVERGVLGTDAAEHPDGVLVRDFPVAPEDPEPNIEACGQRRELAPTPGGPTPTPIEGAQEVAVSLADDPSFAVFAEPVTVASGPVVFRVSNDGTQAHNFRLIATDRSPDDLPLSRGAVDEEAADVVASIPDFAADGAESVAVALLPPGNYVLICNVPGHYLAGMYLGLQVTGQ